MLKPFDNHYSIENVPTVFDEEATTVLELCGRLAGKVNETISQVNKLVTIGKRIDGVDQALKDLVVEPLGYATPQMFGATGDGVTDDTQAIKSAINALGDNSAVLFFPAGVYLVTEDIDLKSNIAVRGTGKGSVIRRAPNDLNNYRVFRCKDVQNVQVTDLTLEGDRKNHLGTSGEWGMCISLEGAQNITIERCYLLDGWGDGVYIGSNGTGTGCENITIRDTLVTGNRRNGVSVIHVSGLTIDSCIISSTKGTEPQAGVDFEPNSTGEGVFNVKIANTIFEDNGKDVLFADTVNSLYFNKSVTFTGCVFKSQGGLDWRTPLNEAYNTANPDCFVRFDGCQFINSYRCIRVTKGAWDTPLTFTGCDFTCNGITVEVGESGKDYSGYTLGGLSLLNCRVHKNGTSNPVVRGVGSNATFATITADLHTIKTLKAFGYFSGAIEDVHLDFHEAVFQIGVNTDFDKYKVPSTIYISTNATNETIVLTLADSFPVGQVVRVVNDGSAREIDLDYKDQEVVANNAERVFYFTITPAGKLAIYGGI